MSLDEACGLASGPGHRDPRALVDQAIRDRMYCEIAARHFANMSNREKARRIARAVAKYPKLDNLMNLKPGSLDADIATLREISAPLSARTIDKIIGG